MNTLMSRSLQPVLFLALAIGAVAPVNARIFEPETPVPRLEADAQTEAVFEFQKEAMAAGEIRDVTGKAPAGKISGSWKFVSPEELKPAYPGAGKVLSAEKKQRSEVVLSGLKAPKEGAFTIDVLMRWNSGGGYFLKIGKDDQALVMGVLHRGPGMFELRVPYKAADGQVAMQTFASTEIYIGPGPVKGDRFYAYSLTYDGKGTFRVWIDGQQAFEGKLPEGSTFQGASEVSVGDVASWKNAFTGSEIAAVRISRGERSYPPATQAGETFKREAKRGWTFDAGTSGSPIEPGTIRLTKAESKDPSRGFGWLQSPKDDFDSWNAAGRFAATPEMSVPKNENKILDALQRDGVILPSGELFWTGVPDGTYWVSVDIGNNRGAGDVAVISSNGVTLGEKLWTNANKQSNRFWGRTARGLVKVEGGKGVIITAKAKSDSGDVPIRSIEILPYAPLPVVWAQGKLVWRGTGTEPAELSEISRVLAAGDFDQAVVAARKIPDLFVRACVLAIISGQPHLPLDSDLAVTAEIRQILLQTIRENPDNTAARWLFDSTERFRHQMVAYLKDGDEVAFGSRFALWLATANQGLQLKPEDPQYWQGQFVAGAGIWQSATQASSFPSSGVTDTYQNPERMQSFDAPGGIFRKVIEAYPDFRIARIMLGEKLPVAGDWKPPQGAPAWAVLQYQLLQRVTEVIHYWVNERMDSKGLLGGGLGDDVEALRWWGPAIVLGDDKVTAGGWRRMAETAWNSTGGKGYSTSMDDVEHSSEPTSDPLPMLALMNYESNLMSETIERLTKTLPAFRDIWTVVTPDGYRMFRGHHLCIDKIQREGDVPYNLRAIKPLVWGAWALDGKKPELNDLLVAYAKSWRDATMAEFDGKPKGIVPMMIMLDRKHSRIPDAKDWVAPGYSVYAYPGACAGKVYELFLAAYEMTGDKSFLEPIEFYLTALRKVKEDDKDPAKYPVASFDWALRTGIGQFVQAGASCRALTGDKSFDDVLLRFGPPHTTFEILAANAQSPEQFQKAMEPIVDQLKADLAEMNTNPELRTTMVQSTDRIYVRGTPILLATATGIAAPAGALRGMETVWPTYQITWQGTDGQLAAMVVDAGTTKLGSLLYNFADKNLALHPRLWKLEPGSYQMTVSQTDESGFRTVKELEKRLVKIERRGQEIAFELPPKVPAKLELVRQ